MRIQRIRCVAKNSVPDTRRALHHYEYCSQCSVLYSHFERTNVYICLQTSRNGRNRDALIGYRCRAVRFGRSLQGLHDLLDAAAFIATRTRARNLCTHHGILRAAFSRRPGDATRESGRVKLFQCFSVHYITKLTLPWTVHVFTWVLQYGS